MPHLPMIDEQEVNMLVRCYGQPLRRGYTLVWLGWQADVALDAGLMRLFAPTAKRAGDPITGIVRS